MSKKVTKYLDIEGEATKKFMVDEYYETGGMNYFNGTANSRGIYVSVIVCEVSDSGRGYQSVSYELFGGGYKHLLKPVNRYSDKQFDAAVSTDKDVIKELVERLCSEKGIDFSKVKME